MGENRAAEDTFGLWEELCQAGEMWGLFSAAFQAAELEAGRSASPVMGTITLRPHPWADVLKARPGVRVVTVTRENRDALVGEVLGAMGS